MTGRQTEIYGSINERAQEKGRAIICELKIVDQCKLKKETKQVNGILKYIRTKILTKTNTLFQPASFVVTEDICVNVTKKI